LGWPCPNVRLTRGSPSMDGAGYSLRRNL
jgi:hypothetical protein